MIQTPAAMRMNVRIKGRVQGVGYRFFVNQAARKMNLTGWVRNLPDGDVEAEAQGDLKPLEQFVHELKIGHPWARVDDFHSDTLPDKTGESAFTIES